VAQVTEKVLADIDQTIVMVSQVDSICATCAKLVNEVCEACLNDDSLMRDYNDCLDARLFDRMELREGQAITVRDFLQIVNNDLDGIVALFTRGDRAERLVMTRQGLEKLEI
jgi:hypothetical protein